MTPQNVTEIYLLNPVHRTVRYQYGVGMQILATIAFLIGIVGNISALWILYKSARSRNKKHVLMLRWLATNDLTAVVGMLLSMYLKRYGMIPDYWCCASFVIIRGFAMGSGTVALIMAMERWMALTRPFLYHKVITYKVLKRTLTCLWLAALFLTYMPFFGFGLWYDWTKPESKRCMRFRYAETPCDRIYAFVFFSVGLTLSIIIALCNISVVWELSRIRLQNRVLVRRISKSLIINNRTNSCPRHHQTPEEVAFSKLMVYICVIFMVCWWPQLVSILTAQLTKVSMKNTLYALGDILLSGYFVLDPYIYVLQRYIEKRPGGICCVCCKKRRRSVGSLPSSSTVITGGTPTSMLIVPVFTKNSQEFQTDSSYIFEK